MHSFHRPQFIFVEFWRNFLNIRGQRSSIRHCSLSVQRFLSNNHVDKKAEAINQPTLFNPKKVLILTKLTRLDFERRSHTTLADEQLEKLLAKRGSSYSRLKERHESHISFLSAIEEELRQANIEFRTVQRFEYSEEAVDWADAVISAGGDGTFLLAASKITSADKPLIGINTDPKGSEGFLCLLRKSPQDSIKGAFRRLLEGNFQWFYRNRIRIKIQGNTGRLEAIELRDRQLIPAEEMASRRHRMLMVDEDPCETDVVHLPELALNDIFIGESLPSRTSYYEIKIDQGDFMKQKSSGIIISTGSGSTSWYFNINKISERCVNDFLDALSTSLNIEIDKDDPKIISKIQEAFNKKLIFSPKSTKIAFCIRDAIHNETFGFSSPRGYASTLAVRSRCYDAHLVIDGGVAYTFNDGAEAILQINPEDALKTVVFR